MSAALLVAALRNPSRVGRMSGDRWTALISTARAERLIGSLAYRLERAPIPPAIAAILADARLDAEREARQALWEADRARAALAPFGIPMVLLKGTAYAAAAIPAARGRFIGDLDILVPRDRLDDTETAILAAGWEWVKPDPYDDAYYRQWMHELPPLIHRDRDRMIDIHHTILPLTARPKPDASAMLSEAVILPNGFLILSPTDMICHAAAHMFADGDLAGGLRNLWDIACLLDEFRSDPGFDATLRKRAALHGLSDAAARAARLADSLYGMGSKLHPADRPFIRRLLARDGWGRETRKGLRFAFFVRSHWLRMPPLMLARHLWTKWRKGHRPA